MSLGRAEGVLTAAGCRVGKVTRQASAHTPVGDVLGFKPGRGSVLAHGKKVEVIVARPPGKRRRSHRHT